MVNVLLNLSSHCSVVVIFEFYHRLVPRPSHVFQCMHEKNRKGLVDFVTQ